MKKRILWTAGICIMSLMLIVGIAQYSAIQRRESDPNWQIAKEIYKVENALKDVDEDYECQSVSKVTPFTYTDSEGNTIIYYCCQTAYLENESGDDTGLDMNAIGMVVDMTQIENKRECKVNEYDAFLCELGDRSYLCWTLSPELSCVIESSKGSVDEASIFWMAKSVPVSKKRIPTVHPALSGKLRVLKLFEQKKSHLITQVGFFQ